MWFKKKATKKEFEELKQILTGSFDRIKVDINSLNNKINNLENRILEFKKVSQVSIKSQRVSKSLIKSQRVSKKEKRMLIRLRQNKRIPILEQIEDLIESGIQIPDIKFKVVDEQGLCSKATFYRYISNIKSHKSLTSLTSLNKVSK